MGKTNKKPSYLNTLYFNAILINACYQCTRPDTGASDMCFHNLQLTSIISPLLEAYMTVGSDVFFWVENLHARYFFGSRDLSCIFLGLEKSMRIFLGLIFERTFCFGFSLSVNVEQKEG